MVYVFDFSNLSIVLAATTWNPMRAVNFDSCCTFSIVIFLQPAVAFDAHPLSRKIKFDLLEGGGGLR